MRMSTLSLFGSWTFEKRAKRVWDSRPDLQSCELEWHRKGLHNSYNSTILRQVPPLYYIIRTLSYTILQLFSFYPSQTITISLLLYCTIAPLPLSKTSGGDPFVPHVKHTPHTRWWYPCASNLATSFQVPLYTILAYLVLIILVPPLTFTFSVLKIRMLRIYYSTPPNPPNTKRSPRPLWCVIPSLPMSKSKKHASTKFPPRTSKESSVHWT